MSDRSFWFLIGPAMVFFGAIIALVGLITYGFVIGLSGLVIFEWSIFSP